MERNHATAVLSTASKSAVIAGLVVAIAGAVAYFTVVQPKIEEYQSAAGQLAVGISALFGNGSAADGLQQLYTQRTMCIVAICAGAISVVGGLALPRRMRPAAE